MTYDYRSQKIVAILGESLPSGQAMNALGHLAFSAGHYSDRSVMGQAEIIDGDGQKHVGISKYPFIVLKASAEEIKNIVKRAKEQNVFVVDYPQGMFDTGPDHELVAALSKARDSKIHAAVLVGSSETIKTLTGHLKLYT